MEGGDIPSFFICPISLQIMRDPVILSTGITYERESIEQWMFSMKHMTCPVTRQRLSECHLTPNHILRRLIQAWCSDNPWSGIERCPTPRSPVDKSQIDKLIQDANSPTSLMSCLRMLRSIASESERNKRCIESNTVALDFLVAIIANHRYNAKEEACDEALEILHSLQISDVGLVDLIGRNQELVESLTSTLRRSKQQPRICALLLLKSVISVIAPSRLINVKEELFREIVKILHQRISKQAMKGALKVLGGLCPWGRNRIKAVDSGAVPVLIELLIDEQERSVCEMVLVVLDRICGCAEGRTELVGHRAGIAVVSKRILRVSEVASERAVRILHSVSRFSATDIVLQEMMQVGVVAKLCLLMQVNCGVKAKEKAMEILMLHSRVWKSSPCLSPQLYASYPSS